MKKLLSSICPLLVALISASAVEIPGKVTSASGEQATIAIEGEMLPAVGDKAEIFFKLAGVEGDVSVASGRVLKVEGDSVQIKIENATGEVTKDQLARIISEKPQKKAAVAVLPKTEDSNQTASIVGAWNADDPGGGKIGFEFNEDATFVWTFIKKEKGVAVVRGKYKLDQSTKPARIDLFETDQPLAGNVARLLGLFELQTNARLKLDFSDSLQQSRDKGLTDGAIIFVKGRLNVEGGEAPVNPPTAVTSPAPDFPPVSPPSSTVPPRRGKLALEDSFDNPKDNLLIEGNKNVNGERELVANPGSMRNRGYYNLPRDFYAEATVHSTTSELNCIVSFYFRTLEDKDGTIVTYESIMFGPGRVAVGSVQNRQSHPPDVRILPAGVYADATRPATIGLEAIGSEYRVFINGNCVTSFTGPDPSKGRGFNLVLHNTGQTACTTHFDNLKVYAASASTKPGGEQKSKSRKR